MALAKLNRAGLLVATGAADLPRVFAQLALRVANFILVVEASATFSVVSAAPDALFEAHAASGGAPDGTLQAFIPLTSVIDEAADGAINTDRCPVFGDVLSTGTTEALGVRLG